MIEIYKICKLIRIAIAFVFAALLPKWIQMTGVSLGCDRLEAAERRYGTI